LWLRHTGHCGHEVSRPWASRDGTGRSGREPDCWGEGQKGPDQEGAKRPDDLGAVRSPTFRCGSAPRRDHPYPGLRRGRGAFSALPAFRCRSLRRAKPRGERAFGGPVPHWNRTNMASMPGLPGRCPGPRPVRMLGWPARARRPSAGRKKRETPINPNGDQSMIRKTNQLKYPVSAQNHRRSSGLFYVFKRG